MVRLRIPVLAAATGLALGSAGCYTVKPVTFESFGGQRLKQVWVTRKDQTVVSIRNAEVSGDKLRGYVGNEYKELPSADLHEIKVKQLSAGRTVALVGGVAAVGVAVMAIVSGSEEHYDGCAGNPRCDEDTPP